MPNLLFPMWFNKWNMEGKKSPHGFVRVRSINLNSQDQWDYEVMKD